MEAQEAAARAPHGADTFARMVSPKSIAIVGASQDASRIGGRPIAYMLAQKFRGDIFPVNPHRASVQGLRAYGHVNEIPTAPEAAIIAVPSPQVLQTVNDLGVLGVRTAIVFSSGFAEVGDAGETLQARIVEAARSHGMRLLGPNTLGLYNARAGYYPIFSSSFESGWPKPSGGISVASQSGAFAAHIFTSARNRRIDIPMCITTGNESDITVSETIDWLVNDTHTDVIVGYVEGIRDGDRFVAALERARRARKPVILLKAGRSRLGRQAAASHTAAIAGDDTVFGAVLKEFGAVRAGSAEELLDFAHLATRKIYPVSNTLGMITISGGAGVLASDEAEALGITLPPLPDDAQASLKALLPFASVRNPVDCTAQALNDISLVGKFTEALASHVDPSTMLAFFTQAGGMPSIAAGLMRELSSVKSRHPEKLYVLIVLAKADLIDEYERLGFTVFEDCSRAMRAIAAMGALGRAFATDTPAPPRTVVVPPLPNTPLNEVQVKELLAAAGIPVVPEAVAADEDDAVVLAERFGYPLVMKIASPDIAHKSDIGGVIVGVNDMRGVRTSHALLVGRARIAAPTARLDGITVARQVKGEAEMIMGVHRDPLFGPIAMVGMGGIFVELLGDVALSRCPVNEAQAETMIRSLRCAPILEGARGKAPLDIKAVAHALARLSEWAVGAGPHMSSVELNPVLVLAEGKGCYAVDALVSCSILDGT